MTLLVNFDAEASAAKLRTATGDEPTRRLGNCATFV
jgi:hypothetical protein